MDNLRAWLIELRGRAERGELARRGYFYASGVPLRIELAARVLLADLEHFSDLSARRQRDADIVGRRRGVLADLRRLREQIG